MSRWFRMYDDVLDDPKVQRLPAPLFKVWVNLLCLASKNGGTLPCMDDVSFALRMDIEAADEAIGSLVERGLIDDADDAYRPHNWDSRQFKSDQDPTAAERQRRKREKEKTVTRDITDASLCPETDTNTKTDSSGLGNAGASQALETKLREAAGWQNEPAPGLFVTGPIEALIANGAILETDVLPVIRGHAPRCRRPSSWRYFVGAIQDAVEARKQASTGPPPSQVVPFNPTSRASHGSPQNRPESLSGRQFLNIAKQRLAEAVARTGVGGGGDVGGDLEGAT